MSKQPTSPAWKSKIFLTNFKVITAAGRNYARKDFCETTKSNRKVFWIMKNPPKNIIHAQLFTTTPNSWHFWTSNWVMFARNLEVYTVLRVFHWLWGVSRFGTFFSWCVDGLTSSQQMIEFPNLTNGLVLVSRADLQTALFWPYPD